jgi:hypothetical protein
VTTGDYRLGDIRHVTASNPTATRGVGMGAAVGFAEGLGKLVADDG